MLKNKILVVADKSIYFVVTLLFLAASCNKEKQDILLLPRQTRQVSLIDKSIGKIISDYIKEKDVDINKRVITVSFHDLGSKQLFTISQFRQKTYHTLIPDYYFTHESKAVVLVYVFWNKFLSAPDVASEIDEVLEKRNIFLPDEHWSFDPPSWEVIVCGGETDVKKHPSSALNYLPCGYAVVQDSVNTDRFYLIQKNR